MKGSNVLEFITAEMLDAIEEAAIAEDLGEGGFFGSTIQQTIDQLETDLEQQAFCFDGSYVDWGDDCCPSAEVLAFF